MSREIVEAMKGLEQEKGIDADIRVCRHPRSWLHQQKPDVVFGEHALLVVAHQAGAAVGDDGEGAGRRDQ